MTGTQATQDRRRHRRGPGRRAGGPPARRARPRRRPPRVHGGPVRPRAGLGPLPGGRGRVGDRPATPGLGRRPPRPCRRPAPPALRRDRARHGCPRAGGTRHRRPEGALPAPAVHRGRDLVPAVLRAGCRQRRRRPVHAGRARRRRVGGERAEGLDHGGPRGPVGNAGRPQRPRSAQAPGADLLPDGHGGGWGRGSAAPADHRRSRVQRGLHDRRPHSRTPTASGSGATGGRWR